MADLLDATDYRVWLGDALRGRRRNHPARTAKALALLLDIDPAHLSRVLAGQKHLAMRHTAPLARFLELAPIQTRFLEALMRHNTAATVAEANRFYLEIQGIRGAFQQTIRSDDAQEYFSSWIHPVMRTLLSLVEFRGNAWARLASMFRTPVDPERARSSVELLERLGLVERDARGILRATAGTVSSGEAWEGDAVRKFQGETIALSGELLETIPRSERDVSTLTLPASRARMDELRDRIRQFRQETMAWARDLPEEDCVVQLNIQLFPVAEPKPKVVAAPREVGGAARRLGALLLTAILLGACGSEDKGIAGRGVITETTNGAAARGRLVSADSSVLLSGEVLAVQSEDVPEAWNGLARSVDSIGPDGAFRLKGLPAKSFDLFAVARDDQGRMVRGTVAFQVRPGDSLVDLPDLRVFRPSVLQGRYAAYDSLVPTLANGWHVRATVRGLGRWVFLDSTGSWRLEDVAPGSYRVRIQKHDGTPGSETTLLEFDAQAP